MSPVSFDCLNDFLAKIFAEIYLQTDDMLLLYKIFAALSRVSRHWHKTAIPFLYKDIREITKESSRRTLFRSLNDNHLLMKHVESIQLYSDSELSAPCLLRASKLERLLLHTLPDQTLAILKTFKANTTLQALSIKTYNTFTPVIDFPLPSSLTTLKLYNLCSDSKHKHPFPTITQDAALSIIQQCPNLTTLTFQKPCLIPTFCLKINKYISKITALHFIGILRMQPDPNSFIPPTDRILIDTTPKFVLPHILNRMVPRMDVEELAISFEDEVTLRKDVRLERHQNENKLCVLDFCKTQCTKEFISKLHCPSLNFLRCKYDEPSDVLEILKEFKGLRTLGLWSGQPILSIVQGLSDTPSLRRVICNDAYVTVYFNVSLYCHKDMLLIIHIHMLVL
jgi:hypothetical protein